MPSQKHAGVQGILFTAVATVLAWNLHLGNHLTSIANYPGMSSDKDHQYSPASSPSPSLAKGNEANKDFECLWGTCQGVSFDCLEELAVHIDQEHLAQFSTRKK